MEVHRHQMITDKGVAGSPPEKPQSPEFSFSVSVQSSGDRAEAPPSFTIDLSPADDIFFHGHLLPLHLLSHLQVPPRSSTNSIDGHGLTAKDFQNDKKESSEIDQNDRDTKSKHFSLFGLRLTRRRKGLEVGEQEAKVKLKWGVKMGFNFSHVLKRYVRIVKPLLQFRWRREETSRRRQSYSFSGNLSLKKKKKTELRGRRGGWFSAPVSMGTSPSNSGVLLAKPAAVTSANDSTMEELQAAIQAAIAHCKNSILKDEKLKC